jgi:hypothetical protein
MASTKDILDHHLKAFDQGDLNAVLSDYAPDVVFFAMGEAFKGVDAIRPLFEALIVEFRQSGGDIQAKAAVGRRRLRLYFVDGGDRRQSLRTGHGYLCRSGRQNRGPVIHR